MTSLRLHPMQYPAGGIIAGDVLSVAAGVVRTYWFYRRVDYGESGGALMNGVSAGDITGLA